MVIRDATSDDIEQMTELWKEFIDFHSEGDPIFTRAGNGHEHWAELARTNLDSDSWQMLVAEVDGVLVGYCLATVQELDPALVLTRFGKIQDIAVTRRYRRQGVGEKLYRRAEAWLRAQGVDRIELVAAVNNQTSSAFWRKLGYHSYMEVMALNLPAAEPET